MTPTEPQPTDAYPGIWTASSADVLNVNVVAGSYKLLSPDVLGITTAPVFHATPTPAPGRRFARSPAFGPSGIVGHQSAVYDYRRQVVISNLPEMVTLHQVMSRVRCGMIVSCILLNTMALGCFGMSVMVRFKNGRDAFNFAEFASNNALIFGGQQADVSLSPRMDRPYVSEYCDGHLPVNIASFRAGGFQTRCLEIHNLPVSCGRVEQDTGEHDAIERLLIIADNTCIVRYRSIWAASRAYAMITQFPGYAGCTVKFAEDPCMGPLDEAILIDNVGVNLDQ